FHSFVSYASLAHCALPSFPTRRSSDLCWRSTRQKLAAVAGAGSPRGIGSQKGGDCRVWRAATIVGEGATRRGRRHTDVLEFLRRSEEHTSELQSRGHLVCRLLLEKKKK